MLVKGVTPSTSFSLPSIAPMLSTFVAHPCIFSYLSSSGSTPFVPFRGRGVMRLCLLVPSLRLRTRTLTMICTKRFFIFVEANWMMHAISISSMVDLLSTNSPWVPLPATNSSSSLLLGISGSPRLGMEWKQLDDHQQQSFFGVPCPVPPGATVLFGARNTPMFCDGSKRAAPELAQTYDY
jgi:hypothetical protein